MIATIVIYEHDPNCLLGRDHTVLARQYTHTRTHTVHSISLLLNSCRNPLSSIFFAANERKVNRFIEDLNDVSRILWYRLTCSLDRKLNYRLAVSTRLSFSRNDTCTLTPRLPVFNTYRCKPVTHTPPCTTI